MKIVDPPFSAGTSENEVHARTPLEGSLHQIVTLAEREYYGAAAVRALADSYYSLANKYFEEMLQKPEQYCSTGSNGRCLPIAEVEKQKYLVDKKLKDLTADSVYHVSYKPLSMYFNGTYFEDYKRDADPLEYSQTLLHVVRPFLTSFSIVEDSECFVDAKGRAANVVYWIYDHNLIVSPLETRQLSFVVTGYAVGLTAEIVQHFDPLSQKLTDLRECLAGNRDIEVEYKILRAAENGKSSSQSKKNSVMVYDNGQFKVRCDADERKTPFKHFGNPVKDLFREFLCINNQKNAEDRNVKNDVFRMYDGDPLVYMHDFLRCNTQLLQSDKTREAFTSVLQNGNEREVQAAVRELEFELKRGEATYKLRLALEVAGGNKLHPSILRNLANLDYQRGGICHVVGDMGVGVAGRSILLAYGLQGDSKDTAEVIIEGNDRGSFKVTSASGTSARLGVPSSIESIISGFLGTGEPKKQKKLIGEAGVGNCDTDPLTYLHHFMKNFANLENRRLVEENLVDKADDSLTGVQLEISYVIKDKDDERNDRTLCINLNVYAKEIDKHVFDSFDPVRNPLCKLRKKGGQGRSGIRKRSLDLMLFAPHETSVTISEAANKGRYSITAMKNIPSEVLNEKDAELRSIDYIIKQFLKETPEHGNVEVINVEKKNSATNSDPLQRIHGVMNRYRHLAIVEEPTYDPKEYNPAYQEVGKTGIQAEQVIRLSYDNTSLELAIALFGTQVRGILEKADPFVQSLDSIKVPGGSKDRSLHVSLNINNQLVQQLLMSKNQYTNGTYQGTDLVKDTDLEDWPDALDGLIKRFEAAVEENNPLRVVRQLWQRYKVVDSVVQRHVYPVSHFTPIEGSSIARTVNVGTFPQDSYFGVELHLMDPLMGRDEEYEKKLTRVNWETLDITQFLPEHIAFLRFFLGIRNQKTEEELEVRYLDSHYEVTRHKRRDGKIDGSAVCGKHPMRHLETMVAEFEAACDLAVDPMDIIRPILEKYAAHCTSDEVGSLEAEERPEVSRVRKIKIGSPRNQKNLTVELAIVEENEKYHNESRLSREEYLRDIDWNKVRLDGLDVEKTERAELFVYVELVNKPNFVESVLEMDCADGHYRTVEHTRQVKAKLSPEFNRDTFDSTQWKEDLTALLEEFDTFDVPKSTPSSGTGSYGDPLKFLQQIAPTIGARGLDLTAMEHDWDDKWTHDPNAIFLSGWLRHGKKALQISLSYEPTLGTGADIAKYRDFLKQRKTSNGEPFSLVHHSLDEIAELGWKMELEVTLRGNQDGEHYYSVETSATGDGRYLFVGSQFSTSTRAKGKELAAANKRRHQYKHDQINAVCEGDDYRPHLHRLLEVFAGVDERTWHDPRIYARPSVSPAIEITSDTPRFPIRKQTIDERIAELEVEMEMPWEKIVGHHFSDYYMFSTRQRELGCHLHPTSLIKIGEPHGRVGIDYYDVRSGKVVGSTRSINSEVNESDIKSTFNRLVRDNLNRIDVEQVAKHLGCSKQTLIHYGEEAFPGFPSEIGRFEKVLHALDVVPLYLYQPEQLTTAFIQQHLALPAPSKALPPPVSTPTISTQEVLSSTIDTLFVGNEAAALKKDLQQAKLFVGQWASIPRLNLGMVQMPTPGMKKSPEDDFLLMGGMLLVENLTAMQIKTREEAEELILRKLMHHYVHNEGFQLSREKAVEIIDRLKVTKASMVDTPVASKR